MSCSSSEELSHIVDMKELHFCQESCGLVALLVLLYKKTRIRITPPPVVVYQIIILKKKKKKTEPTFSGGEKKRNIITHMHTHVYHVYVCVKVLDFIAGLSFAEILTSVKFLSFCLDL